MGRSFRSVVLTSTGDFGDKTDKIKQWVEANGGIYSKDITPNVTHLVCSDKAWKKGVDIGRSTLYCILRAVQVLLEYADYPLTAELMYHYSQESPPRQRPKDREPRLA